MGQVLAPPEEEKDLGACWVQRSGMRGEGISIIVPQMSFKPEICQSGGSMGKTTKKSGQMKDACEGKTEALSMRSASTAPVGLGLVC